MPLSIYEKTVNTSKLDEEILASTLASKYHGLFSDTVTVSINTDTLDTQEQTNLDNIVDSHDPQLLSADQILNAAVIFSRDLIRKYQKLMIQEGLIGSGQEEEVAEAIKEASLLLSDGQLLAADSELSTTTPVTNFLDSTRIQIIRNEIRTFLGLPLV